MAIWMEKLDQKEENRTFDSIASTIKTENTCRPSEDYGQRVVVNNPYTKREGTTVDEEA